VGASMQNIETIHDYLRSHSEEIGARILCKQCSVWSKPLLLVITFLRVFR
jgi:hypothetical protein